MAEEGDYSIPNVLAWLRSEENDISRQVSVKEGRRAGGPRTVLSVDHILRSGVQHLPSFRISTKPTKLPRKQFPSYSLWKIHATHAEGKGRALYCHDLDAMEVVAALSFHIESGSWPLFVTAMASRTDTFDRRYLQFRSESGLLILKQHLHILSAKLGRGGDVDILVDPGEAAELARSLGFRSASALPGLRPGRQEHLRQRAL